MGATISVIIPVYDVAEYLPQCVDSVLTQTYGNLEIILVDDGSTDGSGDICDRYAGQDDRIRVIHKPNGGVSSARNAGLLACTGQYIGFVDADDWIEPEMYEKMVKNVVDNDVVICGFYDYPYGMDRPIPRGTASVPQCNFERAVIQILSRDGYYCTLWNKLFRHDIISGITFDTALSFGEDEVWLLRVLKHAERIAFLPVPLYHWRKREGSATRFKRVTERQLSLLEAKKQSFSLLPEKEAIVRLAKSKMFNDCFLVHHGKLRD